MLSEIRKRVYEKLLLCYSLEDARRIAIQIVEISEYRNGVPSKVRMRNGFEMEV